LKKRMLRVICLGLVLVMMLSGLTACGGSSSSGGSSGGGGNAAGSGDGGSAPPAKVHRLSFSLGDPVTSSKAIYYQELADKTREATNGGLDITIMAGGTLFGHFEVREGVISGAADIGWFCTPFAPGQYPLSEVLQLPLAYGNIMASTYAYLELYKRVPELQQELSEIKVLGLYAGPVNQLFTKKPIHTPADLQGLKIRTMSGVPADCLTAWGASPVFISATEVYEAMDKGVVNGFTFEWSGIRSNTLYEVFDYEIMLPFYTNPFIIMMNKDSYNNIPDEYKAAFDEIWCSDDASFGFAKVFANETIESRALGRDEYGIEEVIPDLASFQVFADEYIAKWSADNSTATFDAGAYFELVQELYAEGCKLYPES